MNPCTYRTGAKSNHVKPKNNANQFKKHLNRNKDSRTYEIIERVEADKVIVRMRLDQEMVGWLYIV